MKFKISLLGNIQNLMRNCGYFLEKHDGQTGEMAFVRPAPGAGRAGYPRFHVYVRYDETTHETVINLHLDQKKPVYHGATAHSGEYDGQLVENEVERIKSILGP